MDRSATFLELVRSQSPRLARLAASYARGPERSDLLQEMWLQIWRSLPAYRGEAALATWAYRIALNTAFSHLRREIRRREADAAHAAPPEARGASHADERRVLDDFLASLGDVDRSVLLLYLEGLSHEQMAEVLGRSPGAVAVRISRLKNAFKRRYLGG